MRRIRLRSRFFVCFLREVGRFSMTGRPSILSAILIAGATTRMVVTVNGKAGVADQGGPRRAPRAIEIEDGVVATPGG